MKPKKSPALRPASALFNALSAVALLFVIGKLIEQSAGEFPTLPAVLMPLGLTAGFYRAAVAPKRLVNMYAAFAPHLLLYPHTPHRIPHLDSIITKPPFCSLS